MSVAFSTSLGVRVGDIIQAQEHTGGPVFKWGDAKIGLNPSTAERGLEQLHAKFTDPRVCEHF